MSPYRKASDRDEYQSMITPEELRAHIELLKTYGVTGPVEVHGIKFTIAPPPPEKVDAPAEARSLKAEYDRMLFAATEGIPDEETT